MLAVQIATVWVTLRASRARRLVRTIANVAAGVLAAVAAVGEPVLRDQMQHGEAVCLR